MNESVDAPTGAIMVIPAEIAIYLFEFVGPRSAKRLGATCHWFEKIAVQYLRSKAYALQLVRGAVRFLRDRIVADHQDCPGAKMTDLGLDAEKYAMEVVAMLAMVKDPLAPYANWDLSALLHALYPLSVGVASDWVLAPYALDWCTRLEREALGCRGAWTPREELRALLHPDALTRLLAIAKKMQWDTGVTYLTAALALIPTITVHTATSVRKILAYLTDDARRWLKAEGRATLCVVVMTAITDYLPTPRAGRCDPQRPTASSADSHRTLWKGLQFAEHKATHHPCHPDDQAWLNLTGLAPEAHRSPLRLLKAFRCKKSGAPPTHDPSERGFAILMTGVEDIGILAFLQGALEASRQPAAGPHPAERCLHASRGGLKHGEMDPLQRPGAFSIPQFGDFHATGPPYRDHGTLRIGEMESIPISSIHDGSDPFTSALQDPDAPDSHAILGSLLEAALHSRAEGGMMGALDRAQRRRDAEEADTDTEEPLEEEPNPDVDSDEEPPDVVE